MKQVAKTEPYVPLTLCLEKVLELLRKDDNAAIGVALSKLNK